MSRNINAGGLDCTGIQTLEHLKFRECPESSGEVAVAVKVCDQPPVEVNETPGLPDGFTSLSQFNEISSVPNATPTTVISLTVGVGKRVYLDSIEVSGDNIAKYKVDIAGATNATRRTTWTDFNSVFKWSNYVVNAGETISVSVEQTGRQSAGDYEARIVGIEETL